MAGEMIAMLHGLGGGRRYGLGDVVANADAAFAEMEAALSNMGGQPAPAYTGAPLANTPGFSPRANDFLNALQRAKLASGYVPPAITGSQFAQGYKPPANLGTDWSVYALPVGILLAAAGVAWYMTREKAL